MEYCIRLATDKDYDPLLLMMKEHAMFEGHRLEIVNNQQKYILEALPVTIFVIHSNDKLVGYMSVIKQFSTWNMGWYLYLDCLYLTEETRGKGIGLKLMNKLKAFAKENMINTIQWQTPKDNVLAIEFYQKLGAINKEKQRFFWPI
jgi:ribosomal protein S18 acetylase RimI-like enzyme